LKSLIILLLGLVLIAALFLTRPQKADFEKFVRDNPQVAAGQAPTKGIVDTIGDKLRTFGPSGQPKSPQDAYLESCTFENRFLWTNVKKDGKLVYTGAVGHWFQRGGGAA
jgi:hypothetical protein